MSKRGRTRTRADILAKRYADDERRAKAKPVKATKVQAAGPTLLYNPLGRVLRTPGGVILIRPQR